jgi:hypothetical protein
MGLLLFALGRAGRFRLRRPGCRYRTGRPCHGACSASLGHRETCADVEEAKVERLSNGDVRVIEPSLADSVAEGLAAGA